MVYHSLILNCGINYIIMKKDALKLGLNKKTIASLTKDEMNESRGGFLSLWSCKSDDKSGKCSEIETHPIPEKTEMCR